MSAIVIATHRNSWLLGYHQFDIDGDGIREAKEHLEAKMDEGFRRSVSLWPFEDTSLIRAASDLLGRGDTDGLLKLINSNSPDCG